MEIREYKKVDEKIEKVTIHHEETSDELGNIIEAYDEVIDKVIPIMGWVSSEVDDVIEETHHEEPSQEERIDKLEKGFKAITNLLEGFGIKSINK